MNADYADRRQYAVGRDRQIFIAMELLFLYLCHLCNLRLISFLRGERLESFRHFLYILKTDLIRPRCRLTMRKALLARPAVCRRTCRAVYERDY